MKSRYSPAARSTLLRFVPNLHAQSGARNQVEDIQQQAVAGLQVLVVEEPEDASVQAEADVEGAEPGVVEAAGRGMSIRENHGEVYTVEEELCASVEALYHCSLARSVEDHHGQGAEDMHTQLEGQTGARDQIA